MNVTKTENETWEERIARERRAEIAEERAALQPLKDAGALLADKLGGGWTVVYNDKPNKDWPDRQDIEVLLVQDIGGGFLPLTFEADYSRRSKRVVVTVKLPDGVTWKYTGHGTTRPEATFDPARGAAGLVGSLKRILGESRIYVTNAVERKQAEDTYRSQVVGVGARLGKIPGIQVRHDENTTDVRIHAYITRKDSERSIAVDGQVYNEDVTLSLRSLPVALAEKVLKLIAKGE